jgi:dUTP pyrophosphatase
MINFEYSGKSGGSDFEFAYQTKDSAAFDIRSDEFIVIHPGEFKLISTGLRITSVSYPDETSIPFAEVRPRSSLSKNGIICHLGTIDADYRGEIKVILENRSKDSFTVQVGDRIAQMMIKVCFRSPSAKVKEAIRGEGGFGSTGI